MPDKDHMHEPDAVPVRNILLFTLFPAIAIAASMVALFALFITDPGAEPAAELWQSRPTEGARLEDAPGETRRAIEARDAAWLARGPGIEAAMAATAAAGWREGERPSRADAALRDGAPEAARALPRERDLRPSSPGGTGEEAP